MTGSVSSSTGEISSLAVDADQSASPVDYRVRSADQVWVRRNVLAGLAVVVALYVLGYGLLLVATNALPYVTDNNESFGAYFHGASLVNLGLAQSVGLTDEAFSPDSAAHPFVYTHGGNFPRVYTALLYAVGARSVQAQIVIATFTIGLFGLILLYLFFSSIARTLFATIATLVFATDYVFFAQWQVNSYRVWHTLLLFAGLNCALPWLMARPRLQFALVVACELCLVYFDLTFAVFASLFIGLYMASQYWRTAPALVRFWCSQTLGATAGAVILVAQNVAYMGWSAFQFDIAQTYGARNTSLAGTPAGDQLLDSVHGFYASHHIVFWRQLGAAGADRDAVSLIAQFVEWTLLPMTPVFSLIVLVLCAGWALSLARVPSGEHPTRQRLSWIIFALATFAAAFSVLNGGAVLGQASESPEPLRLIVAAALAACIALAVAFALSRGKSGLHDLPVARINLGSVLLAAAALFVSAQPLIYDSELTPLRLLSSWAPTWVVQLFVLLAIGLAARLVLRPPDRVPDSRLVGYLACGLVAYAGVHTLLPGYVLSDYLERTAPMTVYVRDAAVALVLTLLIKLSPRLMGASRRPASVGAAVLALALGAFWVSVQVQYVQAIPPTHAKFLELLSEPPFRGASFVSSQYAAPVAAQTGQWAYLDSVISGAQVKLLDSGYLVTHDDWNLWFADADSNPDYAKPRYALCFLPLSLRTLANQLGPPRESHAFGCSRWPIVERARTDPSEFPRDRLVATDPTGLDDWTIVQLDWDYPPYLRSIADSSSDTQVLVSVESTPSGFELRPQYDARQQDGRALEPAELRVYSDTSQNCVIVDTTDPSQLRLPPDFSGPIRVSVTPRTATAAGEEYFSESVWVGLRLFSLPNVVTGTEQQIAANSLDEAEQIAQTAGTWNSTAGTLGEGFQRVPGPDPCAQP